MYQISVISRPYIYFTSNDIILLLPEGFEANVDTEDFEKYVIRLMKHDNVYKIHVLIAQNDTESTEEIVNLICKLNETKKRIIMHSTTSLMVKLFSKIPLEVKMLDDVYNTICFRADRYCYYKIYRDNNGYFTVTKDIRN